MFLNIEQKKKWTESFKNYLAGCGMQETPLKYLLEDAHTLINKDLEDFERYMDDNERKTTAPK